jgi:hypothetical protein
MSIARGGNAVGETRGPVTPNSSLEPTRNGKRAAQLERYAA